MQAAQQVEALQRFLALVELRDSWSGALLVGIGLDEAGRALALASLAAGAASLFLEGDRQLLRAAQREGCCSFSVSTLEEAIRALKNEVRQGRGISIALGGEPALSLEEIVCRGLQPQAIAFTRGAQGSEAASCETLHVRGSVILPGAASLSAADAGQKSGLKSAWRIGFSSAAHLAERRQRDGELMAVLKAAEVTVGPAVRWLRAAPSLFPRALDRAYLVVDSRA